MGPKVIRGHSRSKKLTEGYLSSMDWVQVKRQINRTRPPGSQLITGLLKQHIIIFIDWFIKNEIILTIAQ